ncbi:MAG: AAA family ATPase [Candidatus Margulisiibacteriota bacterium]
MADIRRNIQPKLEALLALFPVVMIVGARQTGKTTLAKMTRPKWKYVDLEKAMDYERISQDLSFFFQENPSDIIIDEAQSLPELFKELRNVIDQNRQQKNRFILTGSSSPELLRQASDSLAGRIAIIELGTLKLNEYYQAPFPGLYSLFDQKINDESITKLMQLNTSLKHKDIAHFHFIGGYPEPALAKSSHFYQQWMENYLKTYINRDIRKLFPRLDIVRFQRFILMLGNMSGTIINRSEIGRSINTSEVTIKDYLDIAEGSFIWRNIISYEKSISKSITKMSKGVIRDAGLQHYLKGIQTQEDLNRHPYVGLDFEAFSIDEIIKGIQATMTTNWSYSYYRTRNGVEIDLILDGPFGILPIEIKYGTKTDRKQISNLHKFIIQHDLPLGLVINNSTEIIKLTDRVLQIPATFL